MNYVIVGNGAAGITAAEEIRRRDPRGHVTVIGNEPYPMYSRPGLAYVITSEVSDQQVIARQPAWYAEHRLSLIHGRAETVDTANRRVVLEDGRAPSYDRLLIATGARAVPPPYPGAALEGVVYLDTLDGTRDLLRRLPRARRAVVIGGGITALELTEGLAHHGVETHYFIRKGSLWSTVFNAEEAQLLEARMRSRGVHLHYHTEVEAILDDGTGHVGSVRLTGGDVFACDLLGAAIGVRPQLDLVRGTDLRVDRGLLVDEHLRTSVPEVFAAGDCAQIYDRWTGQHMLDVLWPSAVAAGRVAGANMSGANVAYQKGTPFNACLLFGLHITAIGQLGGSREEAGVEVVQHTSRGFSEVWATRPHGYASAWVQDGPNTLRLVLSDDRIVGALIVGEQSLADPLRDLIEWQVDATGLRPHLGDGVRLAQTVRRLWSEARLTHRPTSRVPV